MLIETPKPREALVRCIVNSLCNTLSDRQITLMDYLNELAIVIEADSILSDCIVLRNNKYFVFLPESYIEDDLIEIVAKIRLHHIRYYNYYSRELRIILDNEVNLFKALYENSPKPLTVETTL